MKGLEKCLKATEDKSEIEMIQQSIQKKRDYLKQFPPAIIEKKFPSTVDLFTGEKIGGLDSISGHCFYLKNYFLYNNAVHLDVCSIGGLVKRQNGKRFIAKDSSDDKRMLTKSCLYQALFIIVLIRKYYNQELKRIIAEYDNIAEAN